MKPETNQPQNIITSESIDVLSLRLSTVNSFLLSHWVNPSKIVFGEVEGWIGGE